MCLSKMEFYSQPTTFMEVLIETAQYLEHSKTNTSITKEHLIESMENRISILVGKLTSVPTTTSFCIFP
jgi:hypothetical protein